MNRDFHDSFFFSRVILISGFYMYIKGHALVGMSFF